MGADLLQFRKFRESEGCGMHTIRRELALFNRAISFAQDELGWMIPNPVKGRVPPLPEGRLRWISPAEAVALVEATGKVVRATHLADFILLALHTGCRRGELLGLEWSRVDFHGGLIHMEGEHTKAGKRRSVPINETARAALLSRARFRAAHCPHSPWVFAHLDGNRLGSVKNSFRKACQLAGIDDFRVHDLRHTCAAWLVSSGVPLSEIRDLLGHASIKQTEKYAHLAQENVR
ncbi:MAG: site-specific integrase [Magnetococcales bacterium]|nr:site-specific integrase [Magnetococcales bacterium]